MIRNLAFAEAGRQGGAAALGPQRAGPEARGGGRQLGHPLRRVSARLGAGGDSGGTVNIKYSEAAPLKRVLLPLAI